MAVGSGAAEIVVAVGAEAHQPRQATNDGCLQRGRRLRRHAGSGNRCSDMLGIGGRVASEPRGPCSRRSWRSARRRLAGSSPRRRIGRGCRGGCGQEPRLAASSRAQFSEPVTIEQVLTSRMIADPLRLLMCSPVADGAARSSCAPRSGRDRSVRYHPSGSTHPSCGPGVRGHRDRRRGPGARRTYRRRG